MYTKVKRIQSWFVMPLAAIFVMSCNNTSIPASPEPPFNFTKIVISKKLTPVPFTTLTTGQTATFDFELAYTLGQQEAAIKDNLRLVYGFLGKDATNDTTLGFLGDSFPLERFGLSSDSRTIHASANIAIVDIQKYYIIELIAFLQDKDNGEIFAVSTPMRWGAQ